MLSISVIHTHTHTLYKWNEEIVIKKKKSEKCSNTGW